MPRPRTISKPKQLLVEGRDAEAFFYPFLESMGIHDFQIQDYGGISELASFLKQFVLNPQYRQVPVTALGIVRDAEQNAEDAFRSVCGALKRAGLPVPMRPLEVIAQIPSVNVYILPDGHSRGMLETLLLRAVSDDPAFECVEFYLECASKATGFLPSPQDKARFLTFLASRPEIKPLTGYAARAGYLNFDSPAYDLLKTFLHSL